MTNDDEIKPIEEIAEKQEPALESKTTPPPAAPLPAESQPAATAKTPVAPPPPPPTFATSKAEPGKKAVIRRTGGEGGWIKYLILAVVILLIGAGVFYYFFYQVTFEISPTPTADKILLDNNQVDPGTYRVKPGVHELIIEKQGYISYFSSKKYSFGERAVVNFTFKSALAPTLSVDKGSFPVFSEDKKYLFYLDQNSAISVLDLSDKSGKKSTLSNGQYPTTKILKVSADKNFALLLDDEALKVIGFDKTDLVNQPETKLPPLSSAINSFSWNNNASNYFPKANSNIIYDLKTSGGWEVYLANLSHSQADIIMQVDAKLFPNFYMDWGESPNQVLITGGEIGVLDLSKRDYKKIPSDKQFIWGKWAPGGKRAVAVDSEGGAWVYQGEKLEKLPFTSKANQIDFIDSSNIAAVSSGKPIKYNFDTKAQVNYAEVKDLSDSISFLARSDVFYFETVQGIYSGNYIEPGY